MTPWLLAVPVGAGLLYLLWPKSGPDPRYAPPPPAPGATRVTIPGGPRYLTYVQRIDAGLLAYRSAKLIGGPGLTSVLTEFKNTLDVVKNMAAADLAQGQITAADLTSINVKIDAAKKEIGA